MTDLTTYYLGLKLNNPVIIGSSGLTNSLEKIKKLEELGAGAVVLKSLFEEQILFETNKMIDEEAYPEADDYILNYLKNHNLDEYLNLIDSAKTSCKIPIIASINCVSSKEWISFAKRIEGAGADALELNVFFLPLNADKKSEKYESLYFDIAEKIKKTIKIPVAIKLGNHFTNLVGIVNKLYKRKVDGVVLFNRFYSPDIDIEKFSFTSSDVLSTPADIRQSLRWVALVSDKVKEMDIAASTGVHDGKAVVKQLLAGASAVQICSTLYKNGVEYLNKINSDLEAWMKSKDYSTIKEFRGRLSYSKIIDPTVYERAQFMKYFSDFL